jgi:hypothetical protein
LTGKSIVICPEQGYGDQMQFVRYIPLLKGMGASRVTLVCRPALAQLFETAGADIVYSAEQDMVAIAEHDFWTFPVSLPFCCRTTLETLPATVPYLSACEDRKQYWAPKLPGGFRIGLVWQGNPEQKNNSNRSLPGLETLQLLWRTKGVSFVSLQKGTGAEEAAHPPAHQPLVDLGAEIRDFADTAAIIEQLDLVITVCTSVAHLTGALGKKCWVLLAWQADWRWFVDRQDSPWYPSIQLFRQTKAGDWSGPVNEIAQQLSRL